MIRKSSSPAKPAVSEAPTLTNAGTTSTNTGHYWVTGDRLYYNTRTVFSGAGSGSLRIGIPGGYTVDTAKTPSGSRVGSFTWLDAGTGKYYTGGVYLLSTTQCDFVLEAGASGFDGSSLASPDVLLIEISVPIV